MGPSGAFLSALAVKAHGFKITGSILINGKPDPVHSYKKIIGFVPQDDIVHGNLTVEENLWFSAKCRLPARMLKQDRVSVVERVIESLGLQAVRSSLVGSVEKHGISGGQRKRVNVGLEMVMEPSLLILDEPTSGLDSSSSQLLLRALRRETLEGVNVSMVVHQPSYSLFQMFDDLVLLAKGGLTVYHGPVRKVEGYFSGLGINVPDRVNPPDFFAENYTVLLYLVYCVTSIAYMLAIFLDPGPSQLGHFSIVAESAVPPVSVPPAPPEHTLRGHKHSRKYIEERIWGIIGAATGGTALLVLLALLILWAWRYKKRKRLRELERAADVSEALRMTRIGSMRAPFALATRTMPNFESDFDA
ncbi:putative ABC-type sulfate transporter [Helianthus annuus]|nr:putative ABC-type sulfate transporter [Helianthus annuus]